MKKLIMYSTISTLLLSGCSAEAIKAINSSIIESNQLKVSSSGELKEGITSNQENSLSENQTNIRGFKNSCSRVKLTFKFGQLNGSSAFKGRKTWNGSISVINGKVKLRKMIKFEGNDRMKRTPDPSRIAWKTETTRHYDGIEAVVKRNKSSNIPTIITIRSGHGSRTYRFQNLKSFENSYVVDLKLNKVKLNSHKISDGSCY